MPKVYTPLDYGKGLRDGDAEKDRNAIQFAIDRALGWTPAGGLPSATAGLRPAVGAALIPAGRWFVDGPIEVYSAAYLNISGVGGATEIRPEVGTALPQVWDLNGFRLSSLGNMHIRTTPGDPTVSGAAISFGWDTAKSAASSSHTSFANIVTRGDFGIGWHIGANGVVTPDIASIYYSNIRTYGNFENGDTVGASTSGQAGFRFEYSGNLLIHVVRGSTISGFGHAIHEEAGVDAVHFQGLNAVDVDTVFYGYGGGGETTISDWRAEKARTLFYRGGAAIASQLTFRNGEFACGEMDPSGLLGDWRAAGRLCLDAMRINDVNMPDGYTSDPHIVTNTPHPHHVSLKGIDQRWASAVGATGFVQPAGATPTTVSVEGVTRRTTPSNGGSSEALANTVG